MTHFKLKLPDRYQWEYQELYDEHLKNATIDHNHTISSILANDDFQRTHKNAFKIDKMFQNVLSQVHLGSRNQIPYLYVGFNCIFYNGFIKCIKVYDTEKQHDVYLIDDDKAYINLFKKFANSEIEGYNTRKQLQIVPIIAFKEPIIQLTFADLSTDFKNKISETILAKYK